MNRTNLTDYRTHLKNAGGKTRPEGEKPEGEGWNGGGMQWETWVGGSYEPGRWQWGTGQNPQRPRVAAYSGASSLEHGNATSYAEYTLAAALAFAPRAF